ncbi:Pex19-domain-containing protein [Venturia nashicola]|uniref:Pex19-domain-containing protein n=1 Tax=Venturia nashicola TaxID=86259 RepID=A0A4Z1NGQ9_9PEZI|nr:Pex19-domain-containing protein [Venturia nashicola]TLD18928.1 Pex19-domain-containing protein [Venturia nashicola]
MSTETPKTDPAAPPKQIHHAPEVSLSEAAKSPAQTSTVKPLETPIQSTPAPSAVEDAPDPDEDDLDDLDDVLDEFAATNLNSSKSNPVLSGPGRPSASSNTIPSDSFASLGADGLLPDDDEFTRSLQAGMAELLGDLEGNPEMQKQFEDLVKELGEGVTAVGAEPASTTGASTTTKGLEGDTIAAALSELPGTTASNQAPTDKAKVEASFQETIRATMERMNASSASATEATSSSAARPDDFLSAMLAEMEKGGGDSPSLLGGAGGDEDFSKLLLGMMEQLTNKDILYEPMKELRDKFPAWMETNKDSCKKEDLHRYLKQQKLVGEITGKFEEETYTDSRVEDREYIVERMQQMQAEGSPPPDLVGDMNGADAFDMDQGCAQQ